jgi:hypothetical protein
MKSFRAVVGVVFFLIWSFGSIFCAGEIKQKDGIDGNWYEKVTKNIKDSEYEIRWQEKYNEYQSPNRAQNLRFSYYSDGFKVKNRDEEKWSVLFKLTNYGKEDKVKKYNSNAKLEVEKNKGYVRGKEVEIEFENSEKGMRENFVVKEMPKGSGDLVLFFKVKTSKVKMDVEKEKIDFVMDVRGGAKVLRYGDLNVTDNKGKKLNGYFKGLDENRFAIVVDDRNAEYPVKIDPLSSLPDWSAGSDQDYAHFGISVSLAGDVNGDGYSDVIVGAYQFDAVGEDSGMVFVYHGSPMGLSTGPNWSKSGDQPSCYFGFSVSTAGDVNGDGYSDVIIGAYGYDQGTPDTGKSFVYPGSPGGLQEVPIWQVAGGQSGEGFGYSVSTAGDVNGDGYSDVIVGSPFFGGSSGKAYAYYGSPTGLSFIANWTGGVGQGGAEYGFSVSTAGDVNGDGYSDVIVGAPYYGNLELGEGCAYAYYGSPDGLSSMANWTAESNQLYANFGFSVSTAGDVNTDGFSDVIVGAPSYDNMETDEGAAFIYYGSSSGLSPMPFWTGDSNQEGAQFGYSVSTAGDVNADGYCDVIVGAPYYDSSVTDNGRAYVYYGSAVAVSPFPKWIGECEQSNACFGVSVSTAQDVQADGYSDVIVGAYKYNYMKQEDGASFAYYGSAAGLSSTPNWTAESNQVEAWFGNSASTAGDVNGDGYSDIIIGAYGYDNGETDEGRAFVYYGSASGLSAEPNWTAESDQESAYFGRSVSSAGDVNGDGYSDVIVGAYLYDNPEPDEGRAFVYYGSSSGLSAEPNWTAESNQAEAYFGWSVSTAGDVNGDGYSDVIVGASQYTNGQSYEGRAFVYYGSEIGLSSNPDWTAESNQVEAYFGNSVSTAGDVNGDGYSDIIVGAPYYDNENSDEGSAFVYYGSATGLSSLPDWTGESNQASAYFGYSVSTAGDVNGDGYSDIIVGAYGYTNGESVGGSAFVYYGSETGLSLTPDWTAESNQANAMFGCSVSTAGDVNGDGYSDVIVGAPCYGNLELVEGCAYAYYGSPGGLSPVENWTAESDQGGAFFGISVSTAGDVNGDGYSDVIVGAHYYDNGETNEGRAFVYYGSSSGLSSTPNWTAESNQASAYFGNSVSTAGDVNGDGYSDVTVGAYYYDNGEANEGRAFVYYGSASGLSLTPDWTAESNQASALFGRSVSTAGDVNGDGYSDVIVGAYLYDNGQTDEGRAFVYYGSASGLSLTPNWTAESNQPYAYFGVSVSTAGDVNGDGYSDIIIGAYGYDNGQTDEGAAFVYYGSASGLSITPDWTAESNQASAYFGLSVSTAVDVNGDGYSDVIVGAYNYDNGETDEGSAYVYYGSASGLSLTPDWTAESNQASAYFGVSVSTAGDVNGDGYSDVIVGAYYYDNGETNEGSAFVYYGNEGRGVSTKLEQRKSDYSVPIVSPLLSNSNNSFGVSGNLYSTYGRVLIKAQIEVKQYGTPFDGTGLYQTDWIDINTQGLPFQEVVSGLDDWKLFKWRFRIKYHPKYGKSDLHSRWYYIQSNALQEADFRTNLDPMQDADGDNVLNGEDCRPYDGSVWAAPSVSITEFKITREATNNFTWVVPSTSTWGSQSVTLDILRSTSPSNFNSATCRATNLTGTQTTFTDTQEPSNGGIWYYLVRIENVCGYKMGSSSNGTPRSGISCP